MPVTPRFLPGLVKLDYQHTFGPRQFHIIRWGLVNVGSFVGNLPTGVVHQIALDTQGLYSTHIAPFTTTDVTFDGTTVTDFTSDTGDVEAVTAGGTGTESPPTLPIQVAAVASFPLIRRYRGGKPRAYLSGIAESRVHDSKSWNAAFIAALQSAWDAYISGFAGLSYTFGAGSHGIDPVNRSLFTGHAERPTLLTDVIFNAIVDATIASQRRRRGRA